MSLISLYHKFEPIFNQNMNLCTLDYFHQPYDIVKLDKEAGNSWLVVRLYIDFFLKVVSCKNAPFTDSKLLN